MRIAVVAAGAGADDAQAYHVAMAAALRAQGHDVALVPAPEWQAVGAEWRMVVDASAFGTFAADDDADARLDAGVVALVREASGSGASGGIEQGEPAAPATTTVLRRCARVVVVAEAIGEHLRTTHGVAAEAIRLVVPGTDDAPRSSGSDGPGCAILSVGASTADSDHALLLAALGRLRDLDWQLTIVPAATGDAAAWDALIAHADELGIGDRVHRAARSDAPAIEALWRGADVFALTLAAASDGYGTPVAHALRRGIPLAVTGEAAARTLVAARVGALCAPGDRDTLSKSLRRMIFDTALRRDMAQAAWTLGRALPDWPTQAAAFAAALES